MGKIPPFLSGLGKYVCMCTSVCVCVCVCVWFPHFLVTSFILVLSSDPA